MSEMIERVARALCGSCAPHEEPWNELGLREQQDYRRMARAAIEAMLHPTEEMCRAGLDTGAVDNGEVRISTRDVSWVWQAMIDAALTPPPDTPAVVSDKARSPKPAGATTG